MRITETIDLALEDFRQVLRPSPPLLQEDEARWAGQVKNNLRSLNQMLGRAEGAAQGYNLPALVSSLRSIVSITIRMIIISRNWAQLKGGLKSTKDLEQAQKSAKDAEGSLDSAFRRLSKTWSY